MELQQIIDMDIKPAPSWIMCPWSKTFKLLLRPLKPEKQAEFVKEAREARYNEIDQRRESVVNETRYNEMFSAWVIVDWKGLMYDDLAEMVLLSKPARVVKFKGEINCTMTAKMLLMEHSTIFNNWISRQCFDMADFNAARAEDAEKN